MLKKLSIALILTGITALFLSGQIAQNQPATSITSVPTIPTLSPSISVPTPTPIPSHKILSTSYHVFQTFNNCGPAAYSMVLSYYGINKSQQELGQELRPYQNPQGDNDDKSVSLEELAENSKNFGLIPFHRPNGNPQIIKKFIALGIPVITRTWLKEDDDIGHYRILKGYNDTTGQFIQDDSLQGKNLNYTYDQFNKIWKKYNYEYLVLVPQDKQQAAMDIIGEDIDVKKSWEKAAAFSRKDLESNPDDVYARFNLSVALYHTGDYKSAVEEYQKTEGKLSVRTLWYQLEPVQAFYEMGNYQKVFSVTDQILNNHNRAYSEAYLVRGQSYLKLGDTQSAKREFEKAVFYNRNFASKIPNL